MDGHSSYRQIFVIEDDVSKIAFRHPRLLKTYNWVMMPFSIKNMGTTYQRVIDSIFHDMMPESYYFCWKIDKVNQTKLKLKTLALAVYDHGYSQNFAQI